MNTATRQTDRPLAIVLAVCVLLGAGTTPAWAQEVDTAEVARQIAQRVQTLQALRAQRRRAGEVHREQREAGQRVVESLQRDLAQTTRERDEQRLTLGELEAAVSESRTRAARAQAWMRDAAAAVEPVAESFVRRIDAGIPIDQPTRRQPFVLAAALLTDDTKGGDHDAAIAAVFDHAGDEITLGRSIELANAAVELDGGRRREHTWRLRIGLADALFIAEDGRTRGVWSGSMDEPWTVDVSEDVARQVDALFEVTRERRPPALTPVPVPIIKPSADATDGSEQP